MCQAGMAAAAEATPAAGLITEAVVRAGGLFAALCFAGVFFAALCFAGVFFVRVFFTAALPAAFAAVVRGLVETAMIFPESGRQ